MAGGRGGPTKIAYAVFPQWANENSTYTIIKKSENLTSVTRTGRELPHVARMWLPVSSTILTLQHNIKMLVSFFKRMLGSPKLGNPLIVDGVIVFKLIFLDFTHWIRIQNINETNPCESGYTSQPERQLGTLAYGIFLLRFVINCKFISTLFHYNFIIQ